MADKLAELKAALEGMPDEGLKLVLEFAEYLAKKQRPEGKEPSEAFGWLMDKVQKFDEPQLKIMGHFADFVSEIGRGSHGC